MWPLAPCSLAAHPIRIHTPILGWLMNSGDLQLRVSPMHAAQPPAAAGTLSRASTTNHFPLVTTSLGRWLLAFFPNQTSPQFFRNHQRRASHLFLFAFFSLLASCSWLFSSHSLRSFRWLSVRCSPSLPRQPTLVLRPPYLCCTNTHSTTYLFETGLCEPDIYIDLP